MNQMIEHWDEEHGVSRVVLKYKTSSGIILEGIGISECHPDDLPFISQLTGNIIAGYRAEIDLIKKINNYEIKPGIAALKHLYCTMRHSTKYNPDSYEAIRVKKELAHLIDELEENKETISYIQKELKEYIENKEKVYQRIREGQK